MVQKSFNGGRNWNRGEGIGLNPPKDQEKEWLAFDLTNSQFRNRIYIAWTEFDRYGSSVPHNSTRIILSHSTPDGWSKPIRISDKGGDCRDSYNTIEGAVSAVGQNGEAYNSWSGPLGIMFDKSSDGGDASGKENIIC